MSSLPLSRRPHPNGPATFFYSVDILVCRAFFPNPVSTLKMKRIPLAFHQKIGPEYIFFSFFDRESNLARSYKFENCCSWGCDFVKVPIF